MSVQVKRAYVPPAAGDGHRYLIDRLWPRGVTKERLRLTEWLRDLAPSSALRTWYGHSPERYAGFRTRYRAELAKHPDILERLEKEARAGVVTLVFAARDPLRCNAGVLREVLEERVGATEPT